ncbi:MAG TPA: MscL family protein [Candidatus Saccharimonadales bacterium]|nr:MscL family protein [Candidatus Saccharimonadales bacterium]
MSKPIQGFMDFIREQGVVGLAVGLTMGTAVTVLVNSIVTNMVNPLIGLFLPGSGNLNNKFICLDTVDGVCTNKLSWGIVLSSLISFMTIAALVYFVVKGLGLDKLDKKKEPAKKGPTSGQAANG